VGRFFPMATAARATLVVAMRDEEGNAMPGSASGAACYDPLVGTVAMTIEFPLRVVLYPAPDMKGQWIARRTGVQVSCTIA